MRRLTILAAALLAFLLAWWLGPAGGLGAAPEALSIAPESSATPDAAVAAVETPAAAPTVDATEQRTVVPAPEPTPTTLGPECTLRGRCIDAHGNPISGVSAKLIGWGGNGARMDAWRKDHDEVKRSNQTVTTGDDGVFEFCFWPPPPFQFALDLTAPSLGSMTGRWSQLDPGSTRDLGDITMLAGTLLLGRVVDSNGALVTDAEVHFDSTREGDEANVTERSGEIGYVHGADGTFRGRRSMPRGTYRLDVPHRAVVSPKQIVLDGSVPDLFVDVVIEAPDDSKAVAGVVVDEQGAPVSDVTVRSMPPQGGQHWTISTDTQGRFQVTKGPNAPDAVKLSLQHASFESLTTTETFAWGRTDVRITLQRRPSIEVRVVRAADETPVEDYQLRVLWPGNATEHSSSDTEVRGGTHHDGGRLRIDGVSSGKHMLFVMPHDSELATCVLAIDVQAANPVPIVVRMKATARRELRLQRADGAPIAGARVQLADTAMIVPSSREVLARQPELLQVMPMEQWAWNSNHMALELLVGETDANGTFVLRGPGGRDLRLRLPGPPNAPRELSDVRLDVVTPLVVTVDTGARLEGTVRPVASIVEMRRSGGLAAIATDGEDLERRPCVELCRSTGGKNEVFPPRGRRATVAADGTFALDGIPPGVWSVRLSWSITGTGWRSVGSQLCGEVALQAGMTAHFDIDASFVTPGELNGTVLRNGVPLAEAVVTLIGGEGGQFGGDTSRMHTLTTDKDGRFYARARSGEYRVMLSVQHGPGWVQLTSIESVAIAADRTVAQTFRIDSGTARVRVLDDAGAPLVGVRMELRTDASAAPRALMPTGADGWTEGLVESGSFTVFVWPHRLRDPAEIRRVFLQRSGNPDPLAPPRIPLGNVLVALGQTQEVTLRLPADW